MKTLSKITMLITLLIITLGVVLITRADSNPALFIKTALKSPEPYRPTLLPERSEELFVYRGDRSKKDAFVYVQGGPALRLNVDERNPLLRLPNAQSLLLIHPLQTQMINSSILNASPFLTRKQGEDEHKKNAEILNQTVDYLKLEGKNIHLICHSYGTLICLEYLNSFRNEPDTIVLMGFPLDIDLRTFEVERGEIIRWEDGVNPVKEDPFPEFPLKSLVKSGLDDLFTNMFNLIIVHAQKRYSSELHDVNLNNVIYLYGKFDEASGRPLQAELDFLESKNAQTIEIYGGHRSMWSEHYMSALYNQIVSDIPLQKSRAIALSRIIDAKGITAALEWNENIDEKNKYNEFDEEELNLIGYDLLEETRTSEAIMIFELSTLLFPDSSNAFDSLGEAYYENGDTAMAMTNYKHSIALDPRNKNAKKMIKALKKSQ